MPTATVGRVARARGEPGVNGGPGRRGSLPPLGLFGLISYAVASRAREIGIRIAVGAGRGSIAASVLFPRPYDH